MLKIDDIKNVGFRRAKFGGYKPEDVDAFIDDVQISFEKMISEINRLKESNSCLNAQVRKFKEEDQSIKGVISSAKEIAEKSIDDARVYTNDMISEATEKSKKIMDEAKKEVEINREISERLKSESAKLRKKLDDIYKRHLEIINEIPADVFESNAEDSEHSIDETGYGEQKLDVSKASVSNIRKRFFDIDSKIENSACGGADVKRQGEKTDFKENIFSSDDKFKDLQFGKDYDINAKEQKTSTGVYAGIFRK